MHISTVKPPRSGQCGTGGCPDLGNLISPVYFPNLLHCYCSEFPLKPIMVGIKCYTVDADYKNILCGL